MSIQSDDSLSQAYKYIESCSIREAWNILNAALPADLGNEALVFAIQCCNFWNEDFTTMSALGKNAWFEKGEHLFSSWKQFLKMLNCSDSDDFSNFVKKSSFFPAAAENSHKKHGSRIADKNSEMNDSQDESGDDSGFFDSQNDFQNSVESKIERTLYSFKKGIFSLALNFFEKVQDEGDDKYYAEVCRKKGLCYKKLGSYEIALNLLTESNSRAGGVSSTLAEMADCYALCGESKYAKLLFREAFFIDAQKIDLSYLDSPLIKELESKVREKGFSGPALLEWMAVWGVLFKTFTVKRKLRSQEVLRLKQEIYAKESELKDPANNRNLIIPRLINLYFWLIDYYLLSKENISTINEVLLKIKIHDPAIFSLYVGER